jgi:formate hydrogenlyase subunit 6/NADH:ubiquinone oxidoreductase subunit I
VVRDFIKIPFKRTSSQLLDFITPKPFKKLRANKNPLPVIDHKICIRCADCIKICASAAMNLAEQGDTKQIEIDKDRCIRCYCCHEICPVKAIEI